MGTGTSCMYAVTPVQVGVEEENRAFEIRRGAIKQFRNVSIFMLVCGIISVGVGIVILVEAEDADFPLLSGSPIWSGGIIILAACFGLALGTSNPRWDTDTARFKQRCLLATYYGFAVSLCSVCGISAMYTIWGAVACSQQMFATCGSRYKIETGMNIIAAIMAICLVIVSITVSIMFCYYRSAFQFYSNRDTLEQMRRLLSQQQLQAAQGPGQVYQATEYSTYQYGTRFGANFNQAPPPYTPETTTNEITKNNI